MKKQQSVFVVQERRGLTIQDLQAIEINLK